jgi:hypothetical protein
MLCYYTNKAPSGYPEIKEIIKEEANVCIISHVHIIEMQI